MLAVSRIHCASPAINTVKLFALEWTAAALTEPLGCIIHSSDAVARANTRYAITTSRGSSRAHDHDLRGRACGFTIHSISAKSARPTMAYCWLASNEDQTELKKLGADETIDPGEYDPVEVAANIVAARSRVLSRPPAQVR